MGMWLDPMVNGVPFVPALCRGALQEEKHLFNSQQPHPPQKKKIQEDLTVTIVILYVYLKIAA